MGKLPANWIFALSCLICMLAIAAGAIIEIARQRRGDSLLRPGLFRLRILSALIWIIALAALSYATGFLWPAKDATGKVDVASIRKFSSMLSGAMMLIFIAIALLAYDVLQVARERRVREAQFNRQLDDMAREELAKVQAKSDSKVDSGAEAGDAS